MLNDDTTAPGARLIAGQQVSLYWHVDDGIVAAASEALANRKVESIARWVTSKGFVVGEITRAGRVSEYIGLYPDRSGRIGPTSARLGVLWGALSHLIASSHVVVGEVAGVLGVCIWFFLVRRPLLSIFFNVFKFVRLPL